MKWSQSGALTSQCWVTVFYGAGERNTLDYSNEEDEGRLLTELTWAAGLMSYISPTSAHLRPVVFVVHFRTKLDLKGAIFAKDGGTLTVWWQKNTADVSSSPAF